MTEPLFTAGDHDRLVAALTVYGEARGESDLGKLAVAWVIRNRASARDRMGRPLWWGGPELASVCEARMQFSCWNPADPNSELLRGVLAGDVAARARIERDPAWADCRGAVERVVAGRASDDPTGVATHYHTVDVRPHWAETRNPVATIGRHLFYAGIF